MHRLLSLVLAICLCLSMAACGTEESSAPSTTEASTASTVAAPTVTVSTETEPTEAEPLPTEAVSLDVTIDEQIVYENDSIKLTAKEIDFSDDRYIRVKFLAENNSDANISFIGNYFSINGITMYCGFYIEVAAGKKANGTLDLRIDDLEAVGIENIATVVARDVYIYDNEASETLTHLTFEIPTSIADEYTQTVDSSGQVVYDQNGIVIKYRGIVKDWTDEEVLSFYIENNSSPAVSIYTDDVSVNGFMVYGSMVAYAYPNCVTYEELDFSSSDMEENGIESIEEVSFTLWAYDDESNEKVWETEEITVGEFLDSVTEENNENPPQAIDGMIKVVQNMLAYDNLSITHNGNDISVKYWVDGVSAALELAKAGNVEKADLWNDLVEGELTVYTSILNLFNTAGFEDISLSWDLLDDTDTSRSLLSIVGGEVVFNAAE